MNTIVQLTVSASTHNHGFSLDEFILELNGIMEKDGIAGIASLVLNVIDEQLTLNLCRNVPDTWRPETICCEGRYELAERRGRTLRSRVGTLQLHWRRVRCRRCGKTLVVLRDFMDLAPYQRKTNELEQTVVEVVSEQSYRRSSNHLESIGVIPVPKSTAHRWVADSDCDLIDPGGDTMDLLFSDGSGYKRRPDLKNGITNRGEVRVVFGIENTGRLRPLGAWSEKTWEQIARDVQGKRPDGRAVAEMLISDGQQGMVDAMGRLCDFTQRCHWHASRDLNHTMWQDEAPLKERKESTRELAGILDVVLPKEDVEPVTADDKMALADAAEQAERNVDVFCRDLLRRGYTQAWKYVQQMKRALFQYVNRWLETGLVSPRAASLVERLMREIARRLKRIAHGWSPAGAAKMTRIILKRFRDPWSWDAYWKKKLRLEGKVIWTLLGIKLATASPVLLGR